MIRVQISPFVDTALLSFQVARQQKCARNSFSEDVSYVKLTKVDRILLISEEVGAQTSAARPVEKDLKTMQSKVHLIISHLTILVASYDDSLFAQTLTVA